jgi:hypothetical protein
MTVRTVRGFVVSESPVIVGGLLTGPLFGWFGQQWRIRRAWLGAFATAALFSLEPLARIVVGQAIRFRTVSAGEITVGFLLAGYFVVVARRGQRTSSSTSTA